MERLGWDVRTDEKQVEETVVVREEPRNTPKYTKERRRNIER